MFLRSSEKDFSNHSCLLWVSEKISKVPKCAVKSLRSQYELIQFFHSDLHFYLHSFYCHILLMYMNYWLILRLFLCLQRSFRRNIWSKSDVCMKHLRRLVRSESTTYKQIIFSLKFHSFLIALVNLLSLQLHKKINKLIFAISESNSAKNDCNLNHQTWSTQSLMPSWKPL